VTETPALFTDAWIDACNGVLADVPGPTDGKDLVVTELVADAPEGAHRAITLRADQTGVRLVAGEDPATRAWLTVSIDDAEALHAGALEPSAALAAGRVRVRGDLRAIVEAVSVLAEAHARLRAR
jgi:hypothetical protein